MPKIGGRPAPSGAASAVSAPVQAPQWPHVPEDHLVFTDGTRACLCVCDRCWNGCEGDDDAAEA